MPRFSEVVNKAALEYAVKVIFESEKHPDAVDASIEDFLAGVLWLKEFLSNHIEIR